MSVYLTLDKSAYPTETDSYDDTEDTRYAYTVTNSKVIVHEHREGRKSQIAGVYNFKHVVLVQGLNFPTPREEALF